MRKCGNMKRSSENKYQILVINYLYMALALVSSSQPSPSKDGILVSKISEQIKLAKEVTSLVWLLILKLKSLKLLQVSVPDGSSVMFDKKEWENYVFRVWAQMKVSLPEEFILQTRDINNEQVDFLIQDWIFDINKTTITPLEWANTDLIDGSLISSVSVRVVNTLDLTWLDNNSKEEKLTQESHRIAGLRGSLSRLVNKLLPLKEKGALEALTKPAKHNKFPIFTVSKRNKS